MKNNSVTRTWEARTLRDSANSLGSFWGPRKRKEFAEEIKSVKERAYAVADQAEMAGYVSIIDECLTATFTNSVSAKSILAKINEVLEDLKRSKTLTDELKQKIRKAKERAAWYRAKKNLTNRT